MLHSIDWIVVQIASIIIHVKTVLPFSREEASIYSSFSAIVRGFLLTF